MRSMTAGRLAKSIAQTEPARVQRHVSMTHSPVPRYYILETRALQGLISALEPRAKGRQRRPEAEISALKKERDQLQREVHRSQALVRASQRALGIPPTSKQDDKGKLPGTGRRKRRAQVRAIRTVRALRKGLEAAPSPAMAEPSNEEKAAAAKP
jgi:hypothetical protein